MSKVFKRFILSISKPKDNDRIEVGSLSVSGMAYVVLDNPPPMEPEPIEAKVGKLEISVTGGPTVTKYPKPFETWSASFNISSPGSKTVKAVAFYKEREASESVQITMIIGDNVGPVLSVVEPPGSNIEVTQGPPKTFTVAGTAEDQSGITWIKYRLDPTHEWDEVDYIAGANKTQWYKEISFDRIGEHIIYLQAQDNRGNVSNTNLEINLIDKAPPILEITSPKDDPYIVTWNETTVNVKIEGIASDDWTSVKVVKWKLDDGSWNNAVNKSGDWTKWEFITSINSAGPHEVYVKAVDQNNNESITSHTIDVAEPFDLEDFGYSGYLEDLLNLTEIRIKNEAGNAITSDLLNEKFHQRFKWQDSSLPNYFLTRKEAQVRIAVEVLRSFLDNRNQFPRYAEQAYFSLLTHLGTSYAEIRLVRQKDEDAKENLAIRLGIPLEHLDQLFIQPEKITEEILEEIFGLTSTLTHQHSSHGRILEWQLAYLAKKWLEQDKFEFDNTLVFTPILDPDIVVEGDLQRPKAASQVGLILKNRKKEVEDVYNELKKLREAEESNALGFNQIIWRVFGKSVDLNAIEKDFKDGQDIEDQLSLLYLELNAFLVLIGIKKLAQDPKGVVLDEEWEMVYNILVQVKKRRKFSLWLKEELDAEITLSPKSFVKDGERPNLIMWRASWNQRRKWEKKLEARFKQRASIEEAHEKSIASVEAIVLPVLRQELIETIIVPKSARIDDISDWLTQRLSISFKYSGDQRLSRVEQSIETLQDVLQSLRTGRLEKLAKLTDIDPYPPEWHIVFEDDIYEENDFDTEWQWMGSYATWKGAMFVFGYPENYLLPTLRDNTTSAFKQLIKEIRQKWQLSSNTLENISTTYLTNLIDPELEDNIQEVSVDGNIITFAVNGKKYATKLSNDLDQEELEHHRSVSAELYPHFKEQEFFEEIFCFIPIQFALSLQKKGKYLEALDWFQMVYAYHLPAHERKIYYGLIEEASFATEFRRTYSWLTEGIDVFLIGKDRANSLTQFTLISIIRCFLAFADDEFTRETNESIPYARRLYLTAQELIRDLESLLNLSDFPQNPVITSLKLQASLSLNKIRKGLNIAGMERVRTEPVAIQFVASNGSLVPQTSSNIKPTQYRYSSLIERAKLLVGIAQQIEANFFSVLEKKDAEAYSLLNAQHDVQITKETVELQNIRIDEADGNIKLMELNQDRAKVLFYEYDKWINAGTNSYEQKMLNNYEELRDKQNWMVGLEAASSVANAAINVATAVDPWSKGAAGAALVVFTGSVAAQTYLATEINKVETELQKNTFNANFERRKDEWRLQRSLASKDEDIAIQQILNAKIHKQIVQQEKEIASIRAEQTEAIVEFLNNKFTNVELYEWMSGVLGQVYSYFLQQATVMAQMAANQLAFERQEPPTAFIKSDYWQAPEDSASASGDEESVDRRGLTGSVRLLQDIYQLDQHAFETKKRKLQLIEHFSISKLAPYEFQEFRESGVLRFTTPLPLFDKGFPGHYLRLIKRIGISIVGLIPPTSGVRATLYAGGVSRVVTKGDVFQTIEIRRPSEMIAFTSTTNASGVFELQPDNELLLPFEGMGVDAYWELQLPKAANGFDFNYLADVIFTVEYTALNDSTYRAQVIQNLERTFKAEQAYSFKHDFPDLWYNLLHPENLISEDGQVINASFAIKESYFPPNLKDIIIDHLVLYVVRKEDENIELNVNDIYNDRIPHDPEHPNSVRSMDGVISTRRINGLNWTSFIGKSPAGKWTISLPNEVGVKDLFIKEKIKDILFIISYSGTTPKWPE